MSPPKLNDWSTIEDDPCESEKQEVGYPETKDIRSVSGNHWSDSMCRHPNGVVFSIEVMLQRDMSFPVDE